MDGPIQLPVSTASGFWKGSIHGLFILGSKRFTCPSLLPHRPALNFQWSCSPSPTSSIPTLAHVPPPQTLPYLLLVNSVSLSLKMWTRVGASHLGPHSWMHNYTAYLLTFARTSLVWTGPSWPSGSFHIPAGNRGLMVILTRFSSPSQGSKKRTLGHPCDFLPLCLSLLLHLCLALPTTFLGLEGKNPPFTSSVNYLPPVWL